MFNKNVIKEYEKAVIIARKLSDEDGKKYNVTDSKALYDCYTKHLLGILELLNK